MASSETATLVKETVLSATTGAKTWCGVNYENVFTGTAFVDRLIAKEPKKFPGREAAVRFAQELLKEKHIQSIIKSKTFEDGAQLYYWREPDVGKAGASKSPVKGALNGIKQQEIKQSKTPPRAAPLEKSLKSSSPQKQQAAKTMVDDRPDFLKTSLRKTSSSPPTASAQTRAGTTNHNTETNGEVHYVNGNHEDKSPRVSGLAHLLEMDSSGRNRVSSPSSYSKHESFTLSRNTSRNTSRSTSPKLNRNPISAQNGEKIASSPVIGQLNGLKENRAKLFNEVKIPEETVSPVRYDEEKIVQNTEKVPKDKHDEDVISEDKTSAVSPVISKNASKFGTRLQSVEGRGGNSLAKLLEKDAGLSRARPKSHANEKLDGFIASETSEKNVETNVRKSFEKNGPIISEDENQNVIIGNKNPPGRMLIPKLRHVELGQAHFEDNETIGIKATAGKKVLDRKQLSNSGKSDEDVASTKNDSIPVIAVEPEVHNVKEIKPHHEGVMKLQSDNDASDVLTSDEEDAREKTLRRLTTGNYGPPERSLKANMLKELNGMKTTITKLNGIKTEDNDEVDSTVKENGDFSVNNIKMKVKSRPSLNNMTGRENRKELNEKQRFLLTQDISDMNEEQLKNVVERLRKYLQDTINHYEDSLAEYKIQVELLKKQGGKSHLMNPHESGDSYTSSTMSPNGTPVNSSGSSSQASSRCSSVSRGSFIIPPVPTAFTKTLYAKPTKPEITPECEMRKLFWERIILPSDHKELSTVWKKVEELPVNQDEFARLFRKKLHGKGFKRTKSLRDDKYFEKLKGKKVTKILEDDRSRTIGIMMGSLTCQMDDIKNAIYQLDHSVIEFDGLQQLYNIRPTHKEIHKLQNYVKDNPKAPLDKPEEFLYQLSKMQHLDERLECILLQDRFPHDIYSIDQRLTSIQDACSILILNSGIPVLLSIVLSFGNFMNGGTQRGQADGFQLDILQKLKDVKSQEKDMNLLQYLVKTYVKTHDTPRKETNFSLPEPGAMLQAGQVSIKELKNDLSKAEAEVKNCEEKTKKVSSECTAQTKQPFESHMNSYLKTCRKDLETHSSKLSKTLDQFKETIKYFFYTGEGDHSVSPSTFFTLWGNFLDDFKKVWKEQQAKETQTKRPPVDLNQLRATATMFKQRRESTDTPDEVMKNFNSTL